VWIEAGHRDGEQKPKTGGTSEGLLKFPMIKAATNSSVRPDIAFR